MHFSEEGWLHLSFEFALNQTKRSCVKYRSCCEDTSQAWTVADFWKEEGEVTHTSLSTVMVKSLLHLSLRVFLLNIHGLSPQRWKTSANVVRANFGPLEDMLLMRSSVFIPTPRQQMLSDEFGTHHARSSRRQILRLAGPCSACS